MIRFHLNLLLAYLNGSTDRVETDGMLPVCPREGETLRITINGKLFEGAVNRVVHEATITNVSPAAEPQTLESRATAYCTLRQQAQ